MRKKCSRKPEAGELYARYAGSNKQNKNKDLVLPFLASFPIFADVEVNFAIF